MPYTSRLGFRLLWVFALNATVGVFIAISLWSLQSHGDIHSLPGHLADSFIHSAIYGTAFGLLMPYAGERLGTFRSPWNWTAIIGLLLVLAVVTTALVQLVLLTFRFISRKQFWPEFGYKSVSVFLIALIISLSVWGYERFRDQISATNLQLRTQQLEKERALKLLAEARLSALESRLQPHFLFNTLNSISALIPESPLLAEEMIQRLAALLRISLDARSRSFVSLGEEIRLVKDYAEIEKARLGDRLALSIEIPAGLEALSIPPMILQPLVENSIKYAIAPRIEGGRIRVSGRRESGQLVLSVWDSGPGFVIADIEPGHSVDNLRARLATMLGDRASISILRQDDGTAITLSLPAITCTGFDN